MPILELQQRALELGRIRMGTKENTGRVKDGRPIMRPKKLDRFRITAPSRPRIEEIAALYGGTAQPWMNGTTQHYEVIITAERIPILVPPGNPITQWLETWSGGVCIHRCDGATNVLTDEPCDPDSADHRNVKPTTRLNVVLRDVHGLGVFRLESHGWNAAIELPSMAGFLAQTGGYVEGWLTMHERAGKDDRGHTTKFMVPAIDVDVTPAQILAGGGAVQAVGAAATVPQIEAPQTAASPPSVTAEELQAEISAAQSRDDLTAIWQHLNASPPGDVPPSRVREWIAARLAELPAEAPPPDEHTPAELDALWMVCVGLAGQLDMDTAALAESFEDRYHMTSETAGWAEINDFSTHLQSMINIVEPS